MPGSDISRISCITHPKSGMAASIAKDIANKEIRLRIQDGKLNPNDKERFRTEWKDVYQQNYYKYYAMLVQQDHHRHEKIIYVATANPAATKFLNERRHCIAGFNRTNLFIHHRTHDIIVGRINYPLDEDISIETKEAILSAWTGPLDRADQGLKKKTSDYLDTLYQHDSQRKVKYYSNYDDQRRVILKLLIELLHRNGFIDAPCITRLLLSNDSTEIQKDESNRRPMDTLQKYLLLGKRGEAIKFARTRKIWDHAQCLAFLDKYQPPNTSLYKKDGFSLKDDFIVQLNREFIDSVEHGKLNIVYTSLMNRLLLSDPESCTIVKHPNVASDTYEFALLSANDCEMEFDQSNETFKLIRAIKKASYNTDIANSHLISLGLTTIDNIEPSDDISYLSNLSFNKSDTPSSRTLIISNIDMLILNEIWEYCLNLARGSSGSPDYAYINNLIPYKLIFASKLLDFGLHGMFSFYLSSIKNALAKSKVNHKERDPYYDWDLIDMSVEYLSQVWNVISPSSSQGQQSSQTCTDHLDSAINHQPIESAPVPPVEYQPHQSAQTFKFLPQTIPHAFTNQQAPIPEEVTDFNPDPEPPQSGEQEAEYGQQPCSINYHDNLVEQSRRNSFDVPPPTHLSDNRLDNMSGLQMAASSPVNRSGGSYESRMAESFNAFSPIGDSNDDFRRDSRASEHQIPPPQFANRSQTSHPPPPPPPLKVDSGTGASQQVHSSNQSGRQQTSSNNDGDPQRAGFIANLAGSVRGLLPKTNSKQMILPDDSSKTIVYDEKRGTWIDTTKDGDEDYTDYNEPPPIMPPMAQTTMPASQSRVPSFQQQMQPPHQQMHSSFASGLKSTKNRYPKA